MPLIEAIDVIDAVPEWLRLELWEAVSNLPPIYREAIELHFLKGWSIREIAEEKNLPQGTVLSRIHEAKNRLRERFA